MTKRRKTFTRLNGSTFNCDVCNRLTRNTGAQPVGSTHCPQCDEIAAFDNQMNNDGRAPTDSEMQHINALLADIGKKGGNMQRVRDSNEYVFPVTVIDLTKETPTSTHTDHIVRVDAATLQKKGKDGLRALCKERGISYGKLTVDGMRDAVLAWEERRVLGHAGPDAVLADATSAYQATAAEQAAPPAPPAKAKSSKPQRVSVIAVLREMSVGEPVDIDAIVKRTGIMKASLLTTALSCNSTAPSNKRFYATGLRFKRDGGRLVRTA